MREKVYAFVPAFNEEKDIGNVLKVLLDARKAGLIDEILVVDDGSTDDTVKIARKSGVTLINHKGNKGKSQALKTAVDHFFKKRAEDSTASSDGVVFMCDADMEVGVEQIRDFLGEITGNRMVNMIRSPYLQGIPGKTPLDICSPTYSGFRAVRMSALEPLHNNNSRWLQYLAAGGMALEPALEHLIPWKKDLFTLPLADGESVSSWRLVNTLGELGEKELSARLDGSRIIRQADGWTINGLDGTEVGRITLEDDKCRLIAGDARMAFTAESRRSLVKGVDGKGLEERDELVAYTVAVLTVPEPGLRSRTAGGGETSIMRVRRDVGAFRKVRAARKNVADLVRRLRRMPPERYDDEVRDFLYEMYIDAPEENPRHFQREEVEKLARLLRSEKRKKAGRKVKQ
jgi:hypothetical protein